MDSVRFLGEQPEVTIPKEWVHGNCMFNIDPDGTLTKNPDVEFIDGAWRFMQTGKK